MFAALVVGIIVFRKHIDFTKFKKIKFKDWYLIIFRAVCYSLFGITLFTQAIIITKYANVSFIAALPMVAILGFILLGEKFTWKKASLVLLAFIGVFLVAVKDYSHLFDWGKGEILTLISTVFFSLSYIARKWQSNLLNNMELTVINFFVAFFAVIL